MSLRALHWGCRSANRQVYVLAAATLSFMAHRATCVCHENVTQSAENNGNPVVDDNKRTGKWLLRELAPTC